MLGNIIAVLFQAETYFLMSNMSQNHRHFIILGHKWLISVRYIYIIYIYIYIIYILYIYMYIQYVYIYVYIYIIYIYIYVKKKNY